MIVGSSSSDQGSEAFRWSANGGMVGLGDLPGGIFRSYAYGVSADGDVVVGESVTDIVIFEPFGDWTYVFEAFIWNEQHGIRDLREVLAGDYGLDLSGWTLTRATGISADGLTIVGFGRSVR